MAKSSKIPKKVKKATLSKKIAKKPKKVAKPAASQSKQSKSNSVKLSNGASMPLLGFGTSGITEALPIEQAIVQVGYRHIDTAMKYNNEEVVGQACANAIK